MSRSSSILTLRAIALACASMVPQDTPAPAPVATEIQVLAPGAIPIGTSPEAAALWRSLCDSTSGSTPQPKVGAFELRFDGRIRPVGAQSHDFDGARFRYLEPGHVETAFSSGKLRLRGPKGDWLVDTKTRVATRLAGVELENDRRELDDTLQVARTFVGLIDARSIRLRSLAIAAATPPGLPQAYDARAKSLAWLEVASPDFDRAASGAPAASRTFRTWIGVDPARGLPHLALVAEDREGRIERATALFVSLEKYRALDGFQVPSELRCYSADPARPDGAFPEAPSLTLWLLDGTLRPTLTPRDFEPPPAK